MTDVLSFKRKPIKILRTSAEQAVDKVAAAGATGLLCIGYDASGDMLVAVTEMDIADALLLIEQFKQRLLAGELS